MSSERPPLDVTAYRPSLEDHILLTLYDRLTQRSSMGLEYQPVDAELFRKYLHQLSVSLLAEGEEAALSELRQVLYQMELAEPLEDLTTPEGLRVMDVKCGMCQRNVRFRWHVELDQRNDRMGARRTDGDAAGPSYTDAKGAVPWEPGMRLPEDTIAQGRGVLNE